MVDCKLTLDVQKNGIQKTIHSMSNEEDARYVYVTLTNSGKVMDLSSYDIVAYYKSGSSTIGIATTNDDGIVSFPLPTFRNAGEYIFELLVGDTDHTLFSPMFRVQVEASMDVGKATGETPDSAYKLLIVGDVNYATKDYAYSKIETDALLDSKADADKVYTKAEVEVKIIDKADADKVYTKTETNNLLNLKMDKGDISEYATKEELNTKADKSNTYTKFEVYSKQETFSKNDITAIRNRLESSLETKADFDTMMAMLGGKQNTLTAGEGISITGDTISCTATSTSGGTIELVSGSSGVLVEGVSVIAEKYFADRYHPYSFTFNGRPVLCIQSSQNVLRVDVLEPSRPNSDGSVPKYIITRYNYNGVDVTPTSTHSVDIYPQGGDIGDISEAIAEIRRIINGGN